MGDDAKPWLCSLAYIALYAKGAIAAGHGRDITVGDIVDGIERGTLLEMLSSRIDYRWDFALLRGMAQQEARLIAALGVMMHRTSVPGHWPPPEHRTGLRFLIALAIAAMDHGYWVQ